MDTLEGKQIWMIGDNKVRDRKYEKVFHEVRGLKFKLDAEEMLLGAKVVAYYFGAHSYPSRNFTKDLIAFYNIVRKKYHLAFQIIFVSCDYSAEEMASHIKSHPSWVAVEYNDPLRLELKKKYHITTYPKLVVVDISGRIITRTGRWDVYVAGEYAIEFWLKGQAAVNRWTFKTCLTHNSRVCSIM